MTKRAVYKVASYLILERGQEILLSKRKNTGYEDNKFSFIAGHVELHESPSAAIIREAQEEAGISVAYKDLEFIQVVHRRAGADLVYVDYFFTCRHWTGEPCIMEADKCSALEWAHKDHLPPDTIPFICAVVKRWQAGDLSLHEFGWG